MVVMAADRIIKAAAQKARELDEIRLEGMGGTEVSSRNSDAPLKSDSSITIEHYELNLKHADARAMV